MPFSRQSIINLIGIDDYNIPSGTVYCNKRITVDDAIISTEEEEDEKDDNVIVFTSWHKHYRIEYNFMDNIASGWIDMAIINNLEHKKSKLSIKRRDVNFTCEFVKKFGEIGVLYFKTMDSKFGVEIFFKPLRYI